MTTKFTEEIIVTSDINEMKDKYLAERLLRSWNEEFIDEDSGEVVSVQRNELILERDTFLGSHEISEINFLLQSQDIKEVTVSNQQRGCNRIKNYMTVWVASVEINRKPKNIYLYSNSIETAKDIVEDFVSQKYVGSFRIKSIKETKFSYLLKIERENDENEEDQFYKIEVEVNSDLLEGYNQSFILKSPDAERAKKDIIHYLTKKRQEDGDDTDFEVVIIAAQTISCEDVINHDFSMEHIDNETKPK